MAGVRRPPGGLNRNWCLLPRVARRNRRRRRVTMVQNPNACLSPGEWRAGGHRPYLYSGVRLRCRSGNGRASVAKAGRQRKRRRSLRPTAMTPAAEAMKRKVRRPATKGPGTDRRAVAARDSPAPIRRYSAVVVRREGRPGNPSFGRAFIWCPAGPSVPPTPPAGGRPPGRPFLWLRDRYRQVRGGNSPRATCCGSWPSAWLHLPAGPTEVGRLRRRPTRGGNEPADANGPH
jgi:hypothetical protein